MTAGIFAGGAVDPSTLPMSSPWASSDLTRVVWNDIFGQIEPPNTRASAMGIPAVARARNLIVTSLQRLPLAELETATPPPEQPGWIIRTTDGTSPQLRNVWTADDLIFYGWSCWEADGRDGTGRPLAANRIPQSDWRIDEDTMRVLVNEEPGHDVILIPGFHEGVLAYGRGAIADTLAIYRAVKQRVETPVPPIHLRQVSGTPLTDEKEIDALTSRWARARAKGGVGFSNQHIEVVPLDTSNGDSLMIEARNAAALDLARLIGVAGSRIDATVDKASLNYETTTGRNWEFLDIDLALYTDPITARLSMDDWTPPGRRVAFNTNQFTTLTPAPTGAPLQD